MYIKEFKELFIKSFLAYFKNLPLFSAIALTFFIPLAIFDAWVRSEVDFTALMYLYHTYSLKRLISEIVIISLYIFIVISAVLLFQIAVIKAMDNIFNGRKAGVFLIYREAFESLGAYFIVLYMGFLRVALWSLCLIVPGLVYLFFYSLAGYGLLIEHKHNTFALEFSQSIIRAQWRKYLGYLLGLVATMSMIYIAIGKFFQWLFNIDFKCDFTIKLFVGVVLNDIISVIVMVFIPVFLYFVYKELTRPNDI